MKIINQKILNHYLEFSPYTDLGLYKEIIKKTLPDTIPEIGLLVRKQLVHRMILKNGNTGSNRDLRYGDMTKIPWYRQPEDDIFATVGSMMVEIFRSDPRGFVLDRNAENKPILTCRATAILMASILKTKGIPTRVRSGFAPYFVVEGLPSGKSDDHWINQYWDKEETRWVTIDVDGSLENYTELNYYDLPDGIFDYSADAWLAVRNRRIDEKHFWNSGGTGGLIAISWELFYDFHCLMNDEVIYQHTPEITHFVNFDKLSEVQLSEIDNLAKLMQNPDDNFDEIKNIWDTKKEFRLVKGGVI